MELQLKFKPLGSGKVAGAFIRGNSPTAWLRTISGWNIDPDALICLAMPESNGSAKPAGLFVIFKKETPSVSDLPHPYRLLAGKLFIPLEAELEPAVTEAELKLLLVWDYQVFHPAIGFVGFERKDQLNLANLLEYTPPNAKAWDMARPGLPDMLPLSGIRLEKQDTEDVVEDLKKTVETKPLEDILNNDMERSILTRMLEGLGLYFFKGTLAATKLFMDVLPEGKPDAGGSKAGKNISPTPGLLNQLEDWLSSKVADLEKKREAEINRLLRLFEENPELALQFAIPLASAYFDRGKAPQHTKLSRRSINFNLGKLGGGTVADVWDLSKFQADLRKKYVNSANRELELKDYKKAAYIYAHLLGDFYSAANVLEQGKFFREAAALHKDHIKNPAAAAYCLERGGLLTEAIPLFLELKQYEKAGDLFSTLEQTEQAENLYLKSSEQALSNKDNLEAARIYLQKLKQPEKTREVLLQGWLGTSKAEACLKQYFDLEAESGERVLQQSIRKVYTTQTPQFRKENLLNVLAEIQQQSSFPELEQLCTNIAYEVISEQVALGNTTMLKKLKNFAPGDRLIGADSHRFINSHKDQKQFSVPEFDLVLQPEYRWLNAASAFDQILVAGIGPTAICLARINANGQVTYDHWPVQTEGLITLSFITDTNIPDEVFLYANLPLPIKKLVQLANSNSNFSNQVTVTPVSWLPANVTNITRNSNGSLSALRVIGETGVLENYTPEGALLRSSDLQLQDGSSLVLAETAFSTGMFFRKDHYYAAAGYQLLQISEDGLTDCLTFEDEIFGIAATQHFSALRLAVSTNTGCYLVRVENRNMRISSKAFGAELSFNQSGIQPLIIYIPFNKVILALRNLAIVYDIGQDNPIEITRIACDYTIIAIQPAANRNTCAVLEENGRVSIHKLTSE